MLVAKFMGNTQMLAKGHLRDARNFGQLTFLALAYIITW